MIVKLNKQNYHIFENEFTTINHTEYNNLVIKDKLGYYERIVSLICELAKLNIFDLVSYNQTHGGFVPINCSTQIQNNYILKTEGIHQYNIQQNITQQNIGFIFWTINKPLNDFIVYSENSKDIDFDLINNYEPIILTNYDNILLQLNKYEHYYKLSNTNLYLYVPKKFYKVFMEEFYYYLNTSV